MFRDVSRLMDVFISSQRRDTVCGDHWHWCAHQTPDDSIATFLRIVTNFPPQNYYHSLQLLQHSSKVGTLIIKLKLNSIKMVGNSHRALVLVAQSVRYCTYNGDCTVCTVQGIIVL